jgi:hypothetical protein
MDNHQVFKAKTLVLRTTKAEFPPNTSFAWFSAGNGQQWETWILSLKTGFSFFAPLCFERLQIAITQFRDAKLCYFSVIIK